MYVAEAGEAETEEGRARCEYRSSTQRVGQQQGQKYEQIFCPLMDPEGLGQGGRPGRVVEELPAHSHLPALQSTVQPGTGLATIACWAP